jgi:hypothetical protein
MSRKQNCRACTFMKHGVKTRKTIPHICGSSDEELLELLKKEVNEIRRNPGNIKTGK